MQVVDWQVIIEKHGPAVWQTSYRLLGNHSDAADCFQETFVSALEFCRRQRVRNFPALLARLATARAIDQLRRRFRRSRSETDPADWAALQSAISILAGSANSFVCPCFPINSGPQNRLPIDLFKCRRAYLILLTRASFL